MAAASLGLSYATAAGGELYWIEARPEECGRCVLVRQAGSGAAADVTPAPMNVRSRVHEYGGRPYLVVGDRGVACDFASQQLHAWRAGETPRAVTAVGHRYADFAADASGRLYAVREDHTRDGEPVNAIVAIDLARDCVETVLHARTDFAAYPRPSHDGRLAFVAWDHPDMPWDVTSLIVATVGAAGLSDHQIVAGGPHSDESVLEPLWHADGTLTFLSDRSGFWNLYRWDGERVQRVVAIDADFGSPLWNLGISTCAATRDGRVLARICRNAVDELVCIDLADGHMSRFDLPYVVFGSLGVLDDANGFAIAGSETEPAALITFPLRGGPHTVIRSCGKAPLPVSHVSRGRAVAFPTTGPDGTPREAHAFFHAPCNADVAVPPDARPPLIVLLHGGPTSHATPALNLSVQFWTTRGFAVVNVNYGGSTGYGRAYRNRLRGQWGVVDLGDAVAAVDYLVDEGWVDGARVAIRGGSAGGFTVLAALAFTRRFAAGINYYGIADLEALAADTHKFESQYLDRLVAPLPEGRALYRARSPLHHLQDVNAALITFQGSEDRAVPPEQSRRIVAAFRERGLPVAYVEFEGEQHGLRRGENIVRALEAELGFLGRIFGFVPAGQLPPVHIENEPMQAVIR